MEKNALKNDRLLKKEFSNLPITIVIVVPTINCKMKS